jgi:hypothetical protein
MDLFEFQWWRCRDGYRLERSGLVSKSERFERYRPFEISTLFAIFAKDTPASAQGMLSFCNRFGLLGGGRADFAEPWDRRKPTYEAVVLDQLLFQHRAIRRAFVQFENGDASELIKRCNGDEGLTFLRLRVSRDESGQLGIRLMPTDLIRALWVQFAQYACSGTRLFRCQRCNAPFEVGPGTKRRSTAKFCSDRCKMAAFRARVEEQSVPNIVSIPSRRLNE